MINDVINNHKIQEDSDCSESIEKKEKNLVNDNKYTFKKFKDNFLYLPKKALRIIPNSSIRLPFYFKGKRNYSNWIMKLISSISLISFGTFTVL